LNLPKFSTNSVETYECLADNGIGDALRKTINIYFSGKTSDKSSDLTARKYKIESKAKCGAFAGL